jgi:uncharacterized membrane protein
LEKEFIADDFTPHPVVSNVLNQHLQTLAVMKPQFESEKAMAKMLVAVSNAEKKADKEQETAEVAARHKRASQMEDRNSEVTGNA